MTTEKKQKIKLFLDRLKKYIGVKSDRELSVFLGLSKNTVSMWKQRSSVDYDLIIDKCTDVSIDYLLTGKGPEELSIRNLILDNHFDGNSGRIQKKKKSNIKEDESKISELEREIKNIYEILNHIK